MPNSTSNKQEPKFEITKAKLSFLGTAIGLFLGVILGVITSHFLFMLFGPLLGFFGYDFPLYKRDKIKEDQETKAALELKAKLEAEELKKEEKRAKSQLQKAQKKNRENKASLYENIYTIAGFILATQPDLGPYIKNAEDTIAHFGASKEERRIAVEAFNRALDTSFDVGNYVFTYMTNIGKNREYIEYVLSVAFFISSVDGKIDFEAKDRLIDIAKALGATNAALNRIFKSNGAEERFAREFDKRSKSKDVASFDENNQNKQSNSNSSSTSNKDKTQEALEILGLDKNATFDDVKKAHKKMMLKYHPDRLAAQGLPEDMITIYTEKAKAVQVAFDYLKKLYSDYA